jgi:AcrR family transcriptional regulator
MSDIAVRKGAKTRQIFMEAGRHVFARDGYLNAEISEIARAAGKSNGTFYIYFENKSALLDALIKDFDDYIDTQLAEHGHTWYGASRAGDWRQIVLNLWETFKLHAATLHALSQAALIDEHFAETSRIKRARTRADFELFLKGQRTRGYCTGAHIPTLAAALETMMAYCMEEWLIPGGTPRSPREEKKAMETLVQIFSTIMTMK